MTTKTINDFLTKQLFIERNIVTYRSLSRQQSIHVNDAKNELHAFWKEMRTGQQEGVVATYCVSGEAHEERDEMDIDQEYDGAEDIPETRIVLVGEGGLARVKSQFTFIDAIYVYSLSPSAIHDMDLFCGPMDTVRKLDAQGGLKLAQTVGKIVTEGIKEVKGKGKKVAPIAPPAPVAGPSKTKEKEEQKSVKEEPAKDPAKPKPTGKIDFSKAKTKAEKEKEKKKAEDEKKEKEKVKVKKAVKKEQEEPKVKKEENLKHFESTKAKRKEKESAEKKEPSEGSKSSDKATKESKLKTSKKAKAMLSESEEEEKPKAVVTKKTRVSEDTASTSKPKTKKTTDSDEEPSKPNVRLKKRAILSEDEEAPVAKKTSRAKGKRKLAESDEELDTLMDVDDSQVEKASRPQHSEVDDEEDDEELGEIPIDEDEDVKMEDDITPLPKKARKAKKVIPVGRNGLKKKRVQKSRMITDAKGYMVTEDYSEYESVDEEEADPEPPAKGKKKVAAVQGKTKKEEKEKDEKKEKGAATKPVAKSASTGGKAKPSAKGNGSISSFFSVPKKK